MSTAHIILYVIWILIPLFFFGLALWSLLEKWGGTPRKENPGDFFKQGLFVSLCVILSILIDQFALEPVVEAAIGDLLPLGLFQVLLLPVVLYLMALVIGPSEMIRITKAPRPSEALHRRRQGDR